MNRLLHTQPPKLEYQVFSFLISHFPDSNIFKVYDNRMIMDKQLNEENQLNVNIINAENQEPIKNEKIDENNEINIKNDTKIEKEDNLETKDKEIENEDKNEEIIDEDNIKNEEKEEEIENENIEDKYLETKEENTENDQVIVQNEQIKENKQENINDEMLETKDEQKNEFKKLVTKCNEEKKIYFKNLPNILQTKIFHAILRKYGVTIELENIFNEFSECSINGLKIPNRFQKKSTRADSKAESLIVLLGSIAKSFSYLDLSHCTLSAESLNSLAPNLNNVVEMNLSKCSGIIEWSFLLNMRENLRNLNLSYLEQCGNSQQLCAMLAGLDHLQILDLSFSNIHMNHVLLQIPKLSSLTSLNLQQFNKEGIWTVTDEAISHLIQIKTLRCLYLPGQNLSPTSIYQLVELPYLSELGFIHLIGLGKHSPLATLTRLSSLSIVDSAIFDNTLEGVLAHLTSITRLNLSKNEITGEGITALAMMTDLRTLNVSDNQIGLNRNLDHHSFSCVPNLTDLDISGNPIIEMRPWMSRKQRLSHLEFLFELPQLKILKMDHSGVENGIEDEGLDYLRKLTCLTTLSIKNQSLTDRCARIICKFKNLQNLDLSQNQITNEAIRNLTSLSNLSVLSVRDTVLSDAALIHVVSLPKLENLDIGNTRINADAVAVMERSFPYISINSS